MSSNSSQIGHTPFEDSDYIYEQLIQQSTNGTPLYTLLKDELRGHLHMDSMVYCLKKLIEDDATVVNAKFKVHGKGSVTPLSLAVENRFPRCAEILIEKGATTNIVANINGHPQLLATALALTMPEVMCASVFDKCVELTGDHQSDSLKIQLNWSGVLQYDMEQSVTEKEIEMSFLYSLLEGDKKTQNLLLTHPLVGSFLHYKSRTLPVTHLTILFLGIILYPIAYLIFIYYLYEEACKSHVQHNRTMEAAADKNSDTIEKTPSIMYHCVITAGLSAAAYFLLIVLCAWLAVVLYCMYIAVRYRQYNWRYLKSWRTWVTLFVLPSMMVTLWPALMVKDTVGTLGYQYTIAAIGMLSAWTMLLLQVGSTPICVAYLDVLAKIIIDVLKVYLLFFPLFVGFYMGFSLMFGAYEEDDLGIFHFIIMMLDVGSSEYEDEILNQKRGEGFWFTVSAYTFCVAFIVTIVVVFLNFVLGTAIIHIKKLTKHAEMCKIVQNIQNEFYADLLLDRYVKVVSKKADLFMEFSPISKDIPARPIVSALIAIINARHQIPYKNVNSRQDQMSGRGNKFMPSDSYIRIAGLPRGSQEVI